MQLPVHHVSRRARVIILGVSLLALGGVIWATNQAHTAKLDGIYPAFVTPPAIPKHGPYLISLGGSIAAGVGLRPAYHDHDFPLACGQTADSYAALLAKSQNLPLVQVACSGAQTTHGLFNDQLIKHSSLPPQVDAIRDRLPGSTVAIFIGANDAHWIQLELQCFSRGCPPESPPIFSQGLASMTANLSTAIDDLYEGGAKTVLVNQYFTAITNGNAMDCGHHNLTKADRLFYQDRLNDLNEAIAAGVTQSEKAATLVALDFSHHGLCSTQPWVQGLHEPRPFHPTIAGQQAIAGADQRALTADEPKR